MRSASVSVKYRPFHKGVIERAVTKSLTRRITIMTSTTHIHNDNGKDHSNDNDKHVRNKIKNNIITITVRTTTTQQSPRKKDTNTQ